MGKKKTVKKAARKAAAADETPPTSTAKHRASDDGMPVADESYDESMEGDNPFST